MGPVSRSESERDLSHIQGPTYIIVLSAPTTLFWGLGNTPTKLNDGLPKLEAL